jgi:NADPH:quinone reductase
LKVCKCSKNAKPNEWVLVEAAAGGVGSLLVQLLKIAGCKVVGAARGKSKLDFVLSLGADDAVIRWLDGNTRYEK